jgi:hypothetical protein
MAEVFLENKELFVGFDYPYKEDYDDIHTALMVALGNREASYSNPSLVSCFRRKLLLDGEPRGLVIVMAREAEGRDRQWLMENSVALVSKHPKILTYLLDGLRLRQDKSDLIRHLLGQIDESELLDSLSEVLRSKDKAKQVIEDCKR